jgi:hypothetical protein
MKRCRRYGQLPAFALLIVLTLGLCVTVVRAGSGSITVGGAAPEVTSIGIYAYPTPGENLTHISVDTQYTIVLNVTDLDLLTDERKIEVQLYTTPNNSFNATGDTKHHYSFVWTYDGGFANVSPSGNYFDKDDSTPPIDLAKTWGLFNFVFKLDKLAIYTNDGELHWTVEAYVHDKSDSYAWRSNTFDVNLYQVLSIDSSVAWTGLHAGTYSNPASSPTPNGTWTYTSNAKSEIKINATTPTNAFGNTLPDGSVWVALDGYPDYTNKQNFTNTRTTWLTVNDETQQKSVYWFVDIPAGQPTGAYTFTYDAKIENYDYAS